MTIVGELLARHHERLSGFPAPLEQHYEAGLRSLAPLLTPSQLQTWAETGVELTGLSLRSWEAALEYFRAAPLIPGGTSWEAIETLGHEAVTMAAESAPLAVSFLRSAPQTMETIGPSHVRQWADMGRKLYKGNWKSSALAGQFFEISPGLYAVLRPGQASRLILFVDELSRHSYELAAACLASAPDVLNRLDEDDRSPFLGFAIELAQSSWADTRLYFERGTQLMHKVHAPLRERFLLLTAQAARGQNRSAFQYFEESSVALGELEPDEHFTVLELAEQLAPYSPYAAMDFITAVPQVLQRIRIDELRGWQEAGLRILQVSHDGGEAYFRLQSSRSEDIIETLSARVELSRVGEILRLYCKALTGRDVAVQSSSALADKGIGWVNENHASTEGTTIFLPEVMETFHEKPDNFAAYKVFSTHQSAHLEFGSFEFDFERPGTHFGNLRSGIASSGSATTHMERFFDLFPDRKLASDLFTIAEDYRIDGAIKREYGGIRKPLIRLQRRELGNRPAVQSLPLRQAFVENLVRASLEGLDTILWPRNRAEEMASALATLDILAREGALVEDAAEATLRLYQVAIKIPNILEDMPASNWGPVEPGQPGEMMPGEGGESGGEGMQMEMGDVSAGDDEMDYKSPDEVGFRGDFKPELVQLLMKMREDAQGGDAGDQSPTPLTPEQLQELLEKSAEIDLDQLMEGDLDATTGMFMENLMREAGTPSSDQDGNDGDPTADSSTGTEEGEEPLIPIVTIYYYDEWDFRAQDYKPRWCAVKESKLESGEEDFYENAIREHAGLVAQTRKQFELMKPELFRKIKRLPEGEDFDLDAAIEWMVERRAGASPQEKIYWRRNKIDRDVAVAFLIDMSASTDEEINKRDKKMEDDDYNDDPRKYLSWWVSRRKQELSAPPKRIIDLEKESAVLLMTALEAIGDQYGIYGFSGYGRDNVEFFVIKDFDEHLDDKVKKRLDKITPIRSTRMGPAIRHATHKLMKTDAKVRILFLLSDGRPQDHGYGRDRTEKEYAIHDTKQALNEAKREGITPFALTVDRAGHDYLKTMCADMGYEVVADIEALPSRLPTLYRRLTE
ncbi:MAG: VWA domain-containing protein [Chloroflexi bacterium CFX7]|nr:VWA domain-containing protein [Chloroflexi bacterium CFX7]MCK6564191.1 VWA domain-containing protein [Dehalococcoidia bacterium]MCL4230272.1 VWA domain-containing protein [Dehalococcoidia bacterium]